MKHKEVHVTIKFRIDPECHKDYPAQIINSLLEHHHIDTHIYTWTTTKIEETETP